MRQFHCPEKKRITLVRLLDELSAATFVHTHRIRSSPPSAAAAAAAIIKKPTAEGKEECDEKMETVSLFKLSFFVSLLVYLKFSGERLKWEQQR